LEVTQAIRENHVVKDLGPKSIAKAVLRHAPKLAIIFLKEVFNTVLRMQGFQQHGKTSTASSYLLLYEEFSSPVKDFAYPIWGSAAGSHSAVVNMSLNFG
jgi:hypothetical protein